MSAQSKSSGGTSPHECQGKFWSPGADWGHWRARSSSYLARERHVRAAGPPERTHGRRPTQELGCRSRCSGDFLNLNDVPSGASRPSQGLTFATPSGPGIIQATALRPRPPKESRRLNCRGETCSPDLRPRGRHKSHAMRDPLGGRSGSSMVRASTAPTGGRRLSPSGCCTWRR